MSKLTQSIAALAFSLSSDDDGALQLFPAGIFDAKRGALRGKGPWRIDAESAARLIAAVAQRSNDIMIDYDHGLLLAPPAGQKAIAAGWIATDSLQWRDAPHAKPGLYATGPRWTAAASAHIDADEYRYLSPLFTYDAITGEVTDLINVALTNNPAIDDMQPVTLAAASLLAATASIPNQEETPMEDLLERLRYMLNLPVSATPEEIGAELDKIKTQITGADGTTAGLSALLAAKNDEIAALSAQASAAGMPDPTQYAPIAVVNELRTQLAALSGNTVVMQVQRLIEEGVASGKIIGDAEKAWCTELGKKDLAALSTYLDNATGIAALSGMQTQKINIDTTSAASTPSQAEIEVAKNLGLSVDDLLKQRGV